MAFDPNASQLSEEQIIQQVFDADNRALRTDAFVQVDTINADLTVDIKAASGDDIAIANADGSKVVTVTTVGPSNGLDVNVLGGSSTISGTVDTNINGLNTFQTSQYTIGTSAVQVTVTPLSTRTSMSIKAINTSTNIIYIGNSSGVTTSTGYPLFNGDSLQLDLTSSHEVWLIASAASQTACVLEIGS